MTQVLDTFKWLQHFKRQCAEMLSFVLCIKQSVMERVCVCVWIESLCGGVVSRSGKLCISTALQTRARCMNSSYSHVGEANLLIILLSDYYKQ